MNSFSWYILAGMAALVALLGAMGLGSTLVWGGLVTAVVTAAAGAWKSSYTADGMLPPEERIEWLLETYGWLLEEFGSDDAFAARHLVTPTPFDIPLESAGQDRIEAVFERVREHAGMSEWPCRLKFHETYFSGDDRTRDLGVDHGRPAPRGTYQLSYDGDEAIISCDPSLAGDPTRLVAVLAHEFSHYLLDTADSEPPGGPDALEPATDVASVFLGFGIFAANAAAQFEHHGGGRKEWSWSGYLSEPDFAYALAIFTLVRDLDPEKVSSFLETNPRVYFEKALRNLATHRDDALERLAAGEGVEPRE